MANNNSSQPISEGRPIPEGWKFDDNKTTRKGKRVSLVKKFNDGQSFMDQAWIGRMKRNEAQNQFKLGHVGLSVERYVCMKNGQHFYDYEGMMRYVNYARRAQLPVYMPSFDVEKYDKLNVDERTYEDNVDEKTYEDVLNDVNSKTFYKKAWGTGANDVEDPALGNTGPKTTHFVVDVADMDLEPYFVKPWGTALGNPNSPSFVADVAAMDNETFLERAWGTVANCIKAPALGNTGPRSQHPSFS